MTCISGHTVQNVMSGSVPAYKHRVIVSKLKLNSLVLLPAAQSGRPGTNPAPAHSSNAGSQEYRCDRKCAYTRLRSRMQAQRSKPRSESPGRRYRLQTPLHVLLSKAPVPTRRYRQRCSGTLYRSDSRTFHFWRLAMCGIVSYQARSADTAPKRRSAQRSILMTLPVKAECTFSGAAFMADVCSFCKIEWLRPVRLRGRPLAESIFETLSRQADQDSDTGTAGCAISRFHGLSRHGA